jgi:hypothetical protein
MIFRPKLIQSICILFLATSCQGEGGVASNLNKRNNASSFTTEGLYNTRTFGQISQAAIADAEAKIEKSMNAWSVYNKARFDQSTRGSPNDTAAHSRILISMGSQSLDLELTTEIRKAAAILAELEAPRVVEDQTASNKRFWMEDIERRGTVPYGDDPSYRVFRNVRNYGANGDGQTVS